MFTGERLAGRLRPRQQRKLDRCHKECLLCCWDSVQPLELSETEEQVVADRSQKEFDYSDPPESP